MKKIPCPRISRRGDLVLAHSPKRTFRSPRFAFIEERAYARKWAEQKKLAVKILGGKSDKNFRFQ